ncbi:MAG: hypothetical protein Kow00107_00450 [Planctomycetota bacterium]
MRSLKRFLAPLFLLLGLFISAASVRAEVEAKGFDYFTNMVMDAHMVIVTNFRGDKELDKAKLFGMGKKNLLKWAENNLKPEDTEKVRKFADSNFLFLPEFVDASKVLEPIATDWVAPTDAFIEGMVAGTGDPFTHYFTREELQKLMGLLEGEGEADRFGFIPRITPDGLKILHVSYGSVAFYSGLKPGDIIQAVNGESPDNIDREKIGRYLRGDDGELALKIMRQGWSEPLDIHLRPVRISVPVCDGALLYGSVAYVHPKLFTLELANDVRSELDALKGRGAKAIILDLRWNPGGNAKAAVDLCDVFLRGRKIVTYFSMMNEAAGLTSPLMANGIYTPFERMPMVCLINESSASASEMTSGALQDHQRCTIMGAKSYGKGCAQAPLAIPYSKSQRFIYITMAKYFLPSNRSIHMTGVEPDIATPDGPTGFGERGFMRICSDKQVSRFTEKVLKEKTFSGGRLARGELQLAEIRGYSSLEKTLRRSYPDVPVDWIHEAVRWSLIGAYSMKIKASMTYDSHDRAIQAAIDRLEYETGKTLR